MKALLLSATLALGVVATIGPVSAAIVKHPIVRGIPPYHHPHHRYRGIMIHHPHRILPLPHKVIGLPIYRPHHVLVRGIPAMSH